MSVIHNMRTPEHLQAGFSSSSAKKAGSPSSVFTVTGLRISGRCSQQQRPSGHLPAFAPATQRPSLAAAAGAPRAPAPRRRRSAPPHRGARSAPGDRAPAAQRAARAPPPRRGRPQPRARPRPPVEAGLLDTLRCGFNDILCRQVRPSDGAHGIPLATT